MMQPFVLIAVVLQVFLIGMSLDGKIKTFASANFVPAAVAISGAFLAGVILL